MKHLFFPVLGGLLLTASAFTVLRPVEWKIADNYSIKFDGGDPSGEFKGLKGKVAFDPADLAATDFDVTVDIATINTGNGMKNTHAKSAMWFDAEKYPTIHYVSKTVTKTANGFESKGTLDMHGVQKEITIPFTFENNVFSGSFEINRMDYNINTAEPNHGAQKFKVDINVPVTQ